MFCYQCEQTAKGIGCTVQGVCGKQPDVAALQDLLLYTLMGLSQVAVEGRKHGVTDRDVNVFTVQASFSTLTIFHTSISMKGRSASRCLRLNNTPTLCSSIHHALACHEQHSIRFSRGSPRVSYTCPVILPHSAAMGSD